MRPVVATSDRKPLSNETDAVDTELDTRLSQD